MPAASARCVAVLPAAGWAHAEEQLQHLVPLPCFVEDYSTFPQLQPVTAISVITIFLQQKLYYNRIAVVRAVIIPRSLP